MPQRCPGPRGRPPYKLVAIGLVMLGGLGWLLLAATTDEPWPDALIMAAIWIGVALIGWEAPLIAALFLFLGAFIGTLLAFLVFIFDTLNQIDVKNGRDTRASSGDTLVGGEFSPWSRPFSSLPTSVDGSTRADPSYSSTHE